MRYPCIINNNQNTKDEENDLVSKAENIEIFKQKNAFLVFIIFVF